MRLLTVSPLCLLLGAALASSLVKREADDSEAVKREVDDTEADLIKREKENYVERRDIPNFWKRDYNEDTDKRGVDGCAECKEGFRKNAAGVCEDIDECNSGVEDPCCENQYCENTVGSYVCSCVKGFKFHVDSCIDVDECAQNDTCPGENQMCTNLIGSFQCGCAPGFVDISHTPEKICEDDDECPAECGEHHWEYCHNLYGSYECLCKHGFERVAGGACEDIDECKKRWLNNCHPTEVCVNTVPHYECTCKAGFEESDDGCIDINECTGVTSPCKEHERCHNTHGSHQCVCHLGFERKGGVCQDVDECKLKPAKCGRNMNCQNYPGSHECTPDIGYMPDPSYRNSSVYPQDAIDINECTTSKKEYKHKCGRNSRCYNTEGSYRCHCLRGYKMNLENQCEDINECANVDPCGENEECVNLQGSFRCECAKGYRMDSVAGVCFDIDECTEEPKPCKDNEWCDNTNGSFTCACSWEKGFKLDKAARCKPLCLPGYSTFGNKCYKVIKTEMTFQKSEKRCQQDGGILAEPWDLKQTEHMYTLLRGCTEPAWLGATTNAHGHYMWESSGMPLKGTHDPWTNWAPGQPDDNNEHKGRFEGCMELHGHDVKCPKCEREKWAAGQWNDRPCSDKRYAICETALLH